MQKITASIVASVALLAVTLTVSWWLEDDHRVIELFAIVLVIIGSIYLGFAFKDENKGHWVVEISAASIFILAAAFGLWWNPWLIVGGLIGHGFWDLAHHRIQHTTDVPAWYIPFCTIYDWLAGSYFGIYLLTISTL